jgi:hypothetical protein
LWRTHSWVQVGPARNIGARECTAAPVTPAPGQTLHEFFMSSPLRGANLNLERLEDYPRVVEMK